MLAAVSVLVEHLSDSSKPKCPLRAISCIQQKERQDLHLALVASLSGCDHGLIGSNDKVRNEYILQRQSINRCANLIKIPLPCDLTMSSKITTVDG
jgi:hypothetical protein